MTTARPFLMYQGVTAQAALDLYFVAFPDSSMVRVERYAEGDPGPVGTIKVAVFTLCGLMWFILWPIQLHEFRG